MNNKNTKQSCDLPPMAILIDILNAGKTILFLLIAIIMVIPSTYAKSYELASKKYKRNIKGYAFSDPVKDEIPYNPNHNIHGPDYDIPDDNWKVKADK